MARAAAGQERSPRPPSGRGAHGSGSARSQLALASRLSSIRLWALLRRPVQEPERSPPRRLRTLRQQGSGGEVGARRARNGGLLGADRCLRDRRPWTGKLRVPDFRVSAARVESRTGVCDGARERTPERPRPPLPGGEGGGGPFYPLFSRGGEGNEVGGLSWGKRRGVVRPAQVQAPSRSALCASGAPRPGRRGLGRSASGASGHSQSSEPPGHQPRSLTQRLEIAFQTRLQRP